jgi:hypothetical protein
MLRDGSRGFQDLEILGPGVHLPQPVGVLPQVPQRLDAASRGARSQGDQHPALGANLPDANRIGRGRD